jgi:hypothetical protein
VEWLSKRRKKKDKRKSSGNIKYKSSLKKKAIKKEASLNFTE